MKNEQFDALVKLMRGKPDSAANQAARAVLVDGMTQADAMRQFNATRSTISDAVKRYSEAHDLLLKVYALKNV